MGPHLYFQVLHTLCYIYIIWLRTIHMNSCIQIYGIKEF